jgi:hypothetical protein
VPPSGSGSSFYRAIGPARVLDTRPGESPNALRSVPKVRIGGGAVLETQVANLPGLTPPGGIVAVSLNVTATEAAGPGFVTVYPCGAHALVSNLDLTPGDTVANAVITPVSPTGTICIDANTAVHVIVDINGWFAASPRFSSVGPARVLDTRPGESPNAIRAVPKRPIGGADVLEVAVAGLAGLTPAKGVAAVSLNVTAVGAGSSGFVTVYPCGNRPFASTVNVVPGAVVANAAIAPVSATGTICLYASTAVDVVVDINGWFAGGPGFTAAGPARVLDTRPLQSPNALRQVATHPVGGAAVVQVQLTALPGITPAAGVGAVSLNVTVTDAAGSGFVTVYPCGPRTLVSSVNVDAGETVANAVIAPVSAAGMVCIFASVDVDVVVDVDGWFGSSGSG